MFSLITLQITLLFSTAAFAPEEPIFSAPPPAPPQTFSQSLPLHTEGWNLVSWNLEPFDPPFYFWQILHDEPAQYPYVYADWFFQHSGQVRQWDDRLAYYGSQGGLSGGTEWDLNKSYLVHLDTPHDWLIPDQPLITPATDITLDPRSAWDDLDPFPGRDDYINGWYFIAYPRAGYCKLATIYDSPSDPSGNPADCQYIGPFHWLVWNHDAPDQYLHRTGQFLALVKDDKGNFYLPHNDDGLPPTEGAQEIDQIGVLEPGRGYFLGFRSTANITFQGWNAYPGWPLQSVPKDPKATQNQIASGSHFQPHLYTHWSYPVVIDTVDLNQTPLAAGDEIGVFDGDMCVGATTFSGEFPIAFSCWKDDIATPEAIDGYTAGHEMTFVWFDASANSEITFELPPMTQSVEDDPVAPQHSGFGAGLYALRSMVYGSQSVLQFPTEYKLKQNYPNPFNSSTVIPLELPQRSKVRIEVFNVKGQRVGNLYESIENAGYPKVYYNASQLSSGVYFCRVTAEGLERTGKFSGVSKLVLLK